MNSRKRKGLLSILNIQPGQTQGLVPTNLEHSTRADTGVCPYKPGIWNLKFIGVYHEKQRPVREKISRQLKPGDSVIAEDCTMCGTCESCYRQQRTDNQSRYGAAWGMKKRIGAVTRKEEK